MTLASMNARLVIVAIESVKERWPGGRGERLERQLDTAIKELGLNPAMFLGLEKAGEAFDGILIRAFEIAINREQPALPFVARFRR